MKSVAISVSTVLLLSMFAGCQPTMTADSTSESESASSNEQVFVEVPLAEVSVELEDPTAQNVVTFGGALDQPTMAVGDVRTVAIRAKMVDSWHIYAVDKPTGVNVATKLELVLPNGIEQVGDWDIPPAHSIGDNTFAYESDVVFRTQVRATSSLSPGQLSIDCKVGHQACNDSMCRPPSSTTVSIPVTITTTNQ